jgi:hypothetical protein
MPEGVAAPSAVTMPSVAQTREGGTLLQQAESLGARIELAGTDVQTVVTDRANALAESALAAGEQAIGEVRATFAVEREALAAEEATAVGEIDQARCAQMAALETHAAAERVRLDATILAERTNATTLIAGLQADALAIGEAEAARAIAGSEERAAAILAAAEGIQGEGETTRAEAQRDGARRIARDTAQQCRQAGTEMAIKVREQAARQAEAYQPRLEEFLRRLDEGTASIGDELTAVIADAAGQINAQADQAILAVQEIGAEGSATISAREDAVTAEIDTFVQQRVMQLQEAGTAAAQQLVGPVGQAHQALVKAGQEYAAEVDANPRERDALVTEHKASLQQGYDQAAGSLEAACRDVLAGLDELCTELEATLFPRTEQCCAEAMDASSELRATITQAVGDVTGSMSGASEEARAAITNGIEEVLTGVVDAAARFRCEVESSHAEAMEALAHAVDEGLVELDAKVAEAEAEMGSAVQTIGSRYDSLKSEAEHRSNEEHSLLPRVRGSWWDSVTGFFSDLIASVQQWFIDTFGEFWGGLIFGILAAVVMVIVGIVVIKILAALIACGILAVKILGIVLAVVVVIGVLYLAVTNRWEEYRQDHNGEDPGIWAKIGLGLLGVADLTGIPFLIEGFVGQRVTGGKLEGFARGERIGMGLVFFVASFALLGRFLLRKLRARPPAPPERPARPPERPPPEAERPPPEAERPPPEAERPPPEAERPRVDAGGRRYIDISEENIRATEAEFRHGSWEFKLYDAESGARFCAVEAEAPNANVPPPDGPHLTLTPHKAILPSGEIVNLQARGFSWTTESVGRAIEWYRGRWGTRPPNMSGVIAWDNLANFQRAFARIRDANPGMSRSEIGRLAAREISYGRHRIRLGYGDLSARMSNFGDVTLSSGEVLTDVPRSVYIEALPTEGSSAGTGAGTVGAGAVASGSETVGESD